MLLEIVSELLGSQSIMVEADWGEAINGGFGLMLDGSKDSEKKIKLFFLGCK